MDRIRGRDPRFLLEGGEVGRAPDAISVTRKDRLCAGSGIRRSGDQPDLGRDLLLRRDLGGWRCGKRLFTTGHYKASCTLELGLFCRLNRINAAQKIEITAQRRLRHVLEVEPAVSSREGRLGAAPARPPPS
jgi:hypothetical protein